MRWFHRTPITPENSARMLSLMAAHARTEAETTHRGKVRARARQLCAEMDREVPEALR